MGRSIDQEFVARVAGCVRMDHGLVDEIAVAVMRRLSAPGALRRLANDLAAKELAGIGPKR